MNTTVNPETEAALAAIRADERNPARSEGAPVPDHAPGLERSLERMVEECDQRAVLYRFGPTGRYTRSCIEPKGHKGEHRDDDGITWIESVR